MNTEPENNPLRDINNARNLPGPSARLVDRELWEEAKKQNGKLLDAIKNTVEAWDSHWKPGMKMQPDRLPNALRALRDILANRD
jgi:hypothetical protein